MAQIGDLHSRSLNNTDEASAQKVEQQLEDLVNSTSSLSNTLKRKIKTLESKGGSGRDALRVVRAEGAFETGRDARGDARRDAVRGS